MHQHRCVRHVFPSQREGQQEEQARRERSGAATGRGGAHRHHGQEVEADEAAEPEHHRALL